MCPTATGELEHIPKGSLESILPGTVWRAYFQRQFGKHSSRSCLESIFLRGSLESSFRSCLESIIPGIVWKVYF